MTPSITRAFSAEAFLRFCREKPADERYDGGNPKTCALAQFGYPGVGSCTAKRLGMGRRIYPRAILGQPRTFGALADRLEKVIGE